MNLTHHARERMQRRRISPKRVEKALNCGTEIWCNGVLQVRHGRLRLIVDPYQGHVITAYWQGPLPAEVSKRRKSKKPRLEPGQVG